MSNKKQVLVTATRFSECCPEAKQLLEANAFEVLEPCTEFPRLEEDALREIMPGVDGVIAGLDDWTDEVFSFSPRLRIIARFGLGVDNIDLNAAKSRGIYVTNARESYNSVAEIALGLMLSCLRRLPLLDQATREGQWPRFIGHELFRKRVGLLGFGKIAQTLAQRLSAFECQLFAYDIAPNLEVAEKLGVTLLPSISEVLRESQIVSLHIPAMPETHHIMNKEMFKKFNKDSLFINTARGSLVDEDALYEALKTGQLGAAGIDVFEKEPAQRDNPLFTLDNFFCTPHQGAETYETLSNVGLACAKAIVAAFKGERPDRLLNP